MRFLLLLILSFFAMGALAVTTVPASAVQWSDYHWPSYHTDLGITNKATSEYDVATAVGNWNQAANGTNLTLALDDGSDIEVRAKNISAWYLGLAEVLVDTNTGHILSGRVTLNQRYLKDGNLYGYDAADRAQVLCQEIGHALGLDHQDGNSCMNDDNATLGDYPTPNQADEQTLNEMYGSGQHVDSPPAGSGGGDGGGPPCSKNPTHPNCIPQGAVWITVHVTPAERP